jgi:MFS family permease
VRPEFSCPEVADPGRWRALVVTQFAAFMVLLDVSIVNVALPSIERGLAVSAATAQWVVSGYALALGMTLVPAGRLGDSLGRRPMFLIALAAFVVASALTGAAPSIGLLIAARLLQGVAGGMLIPQNSGLIQQLFRGAERGRAFGIMGGTVGLATAVGPVIGGLIMALVHGPDDWRWVFYVNVPIGLAAMVLATRFVPSTTGDGWRGRDLDLLGSLLLGGGVLSLLIPMVDAGSGGLNRLWWLWGWLRCCWRCSAGGRCAPCSGGGSRCWIRGWRASPATPPDQALAWSTTSGSPASRWCLRYSCRTGWTTRRCAQV